MNKLLVFFIIFFYSLNASAQKKADSIYYLLDSVKIYDKEHLWQISSDKFFKYYTLRFSSIENSGELIYAYNIEQSAINLIDKEKFKRIQLTKLTTLIDKSNQYLNNSNDRGNDFFYIIEPSGGNYAVHKVMPINSVINIISGPDVIKIQPDTSAFKITGLITIKSTEIKKYIGISIITSGQILSTKFIDKKAILILDVGYPDQNFFIIIKDKNLNNFDEPEQYFKKKKVKVTGTVIKYGDRPAIEISNPNQIQVVY